MRVALQVVASVALATASTGCATVPACPAKGGPAWLELTSTHFHVRTDLDPADAAEAVRTFEEIRAAMLATVWPGAPDPPNRTEVIALRSHNELVAFVQVSNVFGVHTTQAPFAPVIVTGGDLQGRERDFLAHELAHELSDWFLPTRPRWYAEGIATFLETARYDRARQNAMVGKPSEIRLLDLRARRTLSAAKLLSRRDPSDVDMAQFEAAAWLLVHYLIDKRPRQFAELQLRFGLLEPADRAWSAALPDLPIDRVDGELWRYRSLGRYLGGERMVPVPAPAIRSRTMTDAEVHAARAFLYIATNLHGDMPKEDVQSETREAVDADAAVVDALAIQFFWLDRPEERAARSALARQATAAHPDSWLAWVMAADAADDDGARRTALTRAIAIAPNVAEALARLAVMDARMGRWEEGVTLSLKAMRLGARGSELMSAHIRSLAHVGRCGDAALLSSLHASGLDASAAAKVRAEWTELAKVCATAVAPRPDNGADQPSP